MKLYAYVALIGLIAGVLASASADPVYFASCYETLYRLTAGGQVESFDFDVKLRGMSGDPSSGDVTVVADSGGSGAPSTFYKLNDPLSNSPSLTPVASFSRQYASITNVGDCLYGFSAGKLYRISLEGSQPEETLIGHTGVTTSAGAAYDPIGDVLYMTNYDSLYVVDVDTAESEYVGDFGVSSLGTGVEFFEGELLAAVQNGTSGDYEIGQLNKNTGQYTTKLRINDQAANQATGFAIIPEPAALTLLLAAAAVGLRRR